MSLQAAMRDSPRSAKILPAATRTRVAKEIRIKKSKNRGFSGVRSGRESVKSPPPHSSEEETGHTRAKSHVSQLLVSDHGGISSVSWLKIQRRCHLLAVSTLKPLSFYLSSGGANTLHPMRLFLQVKIKHIRWLE